ncbi:hypothetical protein ACWGCI_23485 [Streptomyces sp. NPDC054949]
MFMAAELLLLGQGDTTAPLLLIEESVKPLCMGGESGGTDQGDGQGLVMQKVGGWQHRMPSSFHEWTLMKRPLKDAVSERRTIASSRTTGIQRPLFVGLK